jgi:hypothetical protein
MRKNSGTSFSNVWETSFVWPARGITSCDFDQDGEKIVTRRVESGTGEGNQNELTLHFGLGDRVAPVIVEVFWPDGTTSQHNANVDSLIVIPNP